MILLSCFNNFLMENIAMHMRIIILINIMSLSVSLLQLKSDSLIEFNMIMQNESQSQSPIF